MDAIRELSPEEMRDIDGGWVVVVVIGAALLLSGCSYTLEHNPPKSSPTPQPDTTTRTP